MDIRFMLDVFVIGFIFGIGFKAAWELCSLLFRRQR